MKKNFEQQIVDEILTRSVAEILPSKEELKQLLLSGKKLRIKHGMDPTGPKIHLGRAISFWKLKKFQDMGHQIVLIIGDFTAQIGDASDKQTARKSLSEREIKNNMKNYLPQIGKILDLKKTEIHYNSEWLSGLKAAEVMKLAQEYTVAQMINRRNFKERFEANQEIGLHELLYSLYQGYDSVMTKADLELGGSDQLFNFKVGRDLQRIYGQKPQDIMTLEMLIGLDGRKMSTSWGNVVNITDEPKEQFGKLMSVKDELIVDYFRLATKIPLKEIKEIEIKLQNKKVNPRDAKEKLAFEIVKIYHGEKEANSALKNFRKVFSQKELPEDMPIIKISQKEILVIDLLMETKMAASRAEAKRLIEQGGLKINNQKISDWQEVIKIEGGVIIRAGKKKFLKIINK